MHLIPTIDPRYQAGSKRLIHEYFDIPYEDVTTHMVDRISRGMRFYRLTIILPELEFCNATYNDLRQVTKSLEWFLNTVKGREIAQQWARGEPLPTIRYNTKFTPIEE